jgi:hypothetical protein
VDQSKRLAAAEREVVRLREVVKRVTELARRWENAETWEGKPAMVDRGYGARLMIAIEGEEPDVPEVRGRDGEVLEGGPAPDQ